MQQRLQSLKEFIITTINSTTFLESENTDQDDETYTSDSRIEETEEDELEEEEEEEGETDEDTADLLDDDDDDENLDQGEYFSILELPDELILRIFVFLNTKEIYNGLSQVSWRVHKMCLENRLWKKISKKTWNVKEKIPLNWRSYNILKHQLQKTTDEGGALQWQSIPRGRVWPSKRYQNTSTTVGSKIYLIGGQEAATIRFNDIFEFDTETYTFSRVEIKGPSQPPSFARHVAVGIENKIIVHGGYDGLGTYFGVSVFDVEKSTWTYVETKGDKPSARTNHAAAAIGKNLYIFGGIKRTDEDVLEDLGDMYVLDTVSFTWSEIQCIHMPAPRCGHRMLTLRGKLYLFGGGSGEHWTEVYNDIHVFDPETNDWTRIDCAGTANTTTFCSMFALDPFIFIFGGQIKGGTDCSDVVYCYDSLAHSWHTAHPVSSKPDPRDMATMSVCGNSAFLFGGYNSKCFDDVYFLHLSKEANNALETLHNDDYSLPFSPSLSQNSLSDMANENEIENDRDIEDILSRFLQN